jgi:hypothetical protein
MREGIAEAIILFILILAAVAFIQYNIREYGRPQYERDEKPDKFIASYCLEGAQVYFTRENRIEPCALTPEKQYWKCSTLSWNYVGPIYHSMNGIQRRAIWAHPIDNKVLHIIFDQNDFGKRITGFYGIRDGVTTEDPGYVNFTILVDDAEIFHDSVILDEARGLELDVEGAKKIEFLISTDKSTRRHFLFDIYGS